MTKHNATQCVGHRRWGVAGVCLALGLFSAACGGSGSGVGDDGTYEIQVGHVLPTEEPIHQELLATAERIEERTDGKVKLEIFPNAQLGSDSDVHDQAVNGAAVISAMDLGYAADHGVPEMAAAAAPYIIDDTEQIPNLLSSDLFSSWEGELADEGNLVSLSWNWYFGSRHIISNEAFRSPEDLENVSIRVPPNKVWIETFQAIGANPVQLEWSEVYTGLSQGVVDAAEAPLTTLKGSSLHEVADTITLTGMFKELVGFVIGQGYWETLPEEYQDVILEEFQEGGESVTDVTLKAESAVRGELEQLGVTFVEADTDAYKAAVDAFWDQFPNWPDGLKSSVQQAVEHG